MNCEPPFSGLGVRIYAVPQPKRGGDAVNWEEVGAIGQVLGSVAVLITLVYLSVQVAHARQETRRAIDNSLSSGVRDWTMTFATDERLNRLFVNANATLTGGQIPPFITETARLTGMSVEDTAAVLWALQSQFEWLARTIAYIDELPDGRRDDVDRNLRMVYGVIPLSKMYYAMMKPTLNRDAVRYIDELLARPIPDIPLLQPAKAV